MSCRGTWSIRGPADELYLSRNPDVNPYRPLLQGDVLRDIQIAGLDDAGLAIVLTHPCSMRRGPALVPRQLVARVVDAAPFPLTAWATGHMRSMPLPALVPDEPERHFVAQFEEVGAVPSAALVEAERLACLDPRGICLFAAALRLLSDAVCRANVRFAWRYCARTR